MYNKHGITGKEIAQVNKTCDFLKDLTNSILAYIDNSTTNHLSFSRTNTIFETLLLISMFILQSKGFNPNLKARRPLNSNMN